MFPAALLTMILSTRGHLFFSCTAEITPKSRKHMFLVFIYLLFIYWFCFVFFLEKRETHERKGQEPSFLPVPPIHLQVISK